MYLYIGSILIASNLSLAFELPPGFSCDTVASFLARFLSNGTDGRKICMVIIALGEVSIRSDSTNSNEYQY